MKDKMLVLHVATVLIYLTSCLTSGIQIKENATLDRDRSPDLSKLFPDSSFEVKTSTTSTTAVKSDSKNETANVSKAVNQSQMLAEGNQKKTLARAKPKETAVAEGVSLSMEEFTLPSEPKDGTVSQKNRSKSRTMPKKGVDQLPESTDRAEPATKHEESLIATMSSVNETSTKSSLAVTEETPSVIENTKTAKEKLNVTESGIDTEKTGNKKGSPVLVVPSQKDLSITEHNSKPRVTIGKGNDEERMPSLPKEKPLLGTPQKIDYIVPIVITVMTVPLLAIGMFVLYKRSRDCWDRRHYRRMDFLIDGMYND